MTTVFLRAIEVEDKAAALREAIRDPIAAQGRLRFEVDPASFASVPRSPFAYWVSESLRRLFTELPPFEAERRTAKMGLTSNADFRFLRLWWETGYGCDEMHDFAKGGGFSPFYSDIYLVIRWESDGSELKAFSLTTPGTTHWSRNIRSPGFYFRPGLTWPLRTTSGLSLRVMPSGCIFGHKGPAVFVDGDSSKEILALLAITASSTFISATELQLAAADAAARSYEVGVIQRTPVPHLTTIDKVTLATLASRAWLLKRTLDTHTEMSHAFTLPALLQAECMTLAGRAAVWTKRVQRAATELAAIQAEIDVRCFDLYGIAEADRRAITQGFGTSSEDAADAPDTADDADSEDDEDTTAVADAASLTTEMVSWAIGVAFGRFDVRLATGTRPLPSEPEPFDALPVCSPAMLTGDDGLPLATAPLGYPITFPADGVLVDDPGHARDLTAAVRTVFDVVFDNHADVLWHEAAALLDPQASDLRSWLAKSFFEQHFKHYSKSRRKVPILWQLATASGQYAIWLYAHRLTRDSVFQVLNDFISPKLTHEERRFTALTQEVGQNPTASQRKELAEQETFITELRTMRDEVARIAPLWNPDLNDGVVLTMAPLWRLVPQHRVWQKELKTAWDVLCAGKYDWAQVAMHLWPERVVPKCAEDRSLAIAHGLENVFWIEVSDGKWQPKKVDKEMVDTLITVRTSPAVKEALHNLLHAPAPTSSRGRGPSQSTRRASVPRSRGTSAVTRGNGDSPAGTPGIDPALVDAVKQAIASAGNGASKPEILAAAGLTNSQWNVAIKTLLVQGVVTTTGERRGTRYYSAEMGGPS